MPVTIDGTTGVTTPGATVGAITGILKATSGVVAQAVAGTDYLVGGGSAITSTNTAKAWVNFNGTTSPGTIRSSFNVSSVTKNGTGDYTINFTSAMADANYSVIATSGDSSSGIGSESTTAYNLLTSSFKITSATASSGSAIDRSLICAAIFGN